MYIKHNHQRIYINLTAEARVRCWAGNTQVEGLIDPTDVRRHHHRTVEALDRLLRRAIQDIEETTKTGKTEDTKSRTGVGDVEPNDVTFVKSCLKQDAVWQDAVRQAKPRASATIPTGDTQAIADENEVGRMEQGAADNAEVPTSDTHVTLNQQETGRLEKGAVDTDEIPPSDTHGTFSQLESERMEKGIVDTAETATKATGHGDNITAELLSPFPASTSVPSQIMIDSRAPNAGQQAKDWDWDLVDATEALEVSRPGKAGWGRWA